MDEVQTIESAVLSFYRGDSEQQKETHKWLQQVQNSPQAWSFCWDLMQLNKSSEVQFFGSITLNSKLRNDWAELPEESHHELKQKLLETIIVFGNGPKIVLNRLCISLGLFIVHMLQHPTVIEEVTSMFLNEQLGNLTRVTQIEILMAVLEGIPEEVKTVRTAIPRAMVCEELNRNAEFVMQTVVTYLKEKLSRNAIEPQEMNGMINAAKCTGSWVLHGNVRLDERETMIQTLLQAIHYCYWKEPKDDGCLMPEENELAETALKSLASIISSYATQNPKYSVTIIHFMKMFLDVLVPILDAEYKECNDNENLALMMYGLFIATLEGFASAIFDGIATESEEVASVYTRTVDMLIKCTDKPGTYPVDEMCSSYALEFWYMLQEEVLSMDTGEHRNRCHDAIRPVYAHVVKVLVRKSQLPTDSSMHKWNDDDLEAFRCYRQDIGDTLLSCHDVLGNMMLDVLSEALDESIMYLSYEQHQPTTDSWTLLEATIHAFCSIAQKVELMEHPQIVKLLKVLNEIPYEKYHDKLLGMALETVGAYSEWFGENPKYLPSAITLLVKGLSSTKASQATLGLKDLTSECHKEVVPYALPLLDACRTVLQDGQLKNPEMIRLMYTVGNILSVISYENIIIYLDAMVSPCFEELGIHVQNNDISEQAKARVVLRLEMISKLFSSLNINKTPPGADGGGEDKDGQKLCLPVRTSPADPRPVQPILLILQKTMGLLKSLCTLWIHDETVIDTLCKALQQALTTLMDDMKPLLNEMCCLVLSILNTNCVVSTADIAGNIILMFYNDQECRPLIVQLFTAIMDYNFNQMQANLDKLSRIADLIETFYAFNTRISKKIPICYSEVQIDCMQLVDYATKCMMLPEMPPMKKSVAFLTTFIKESPKHPIMGNVVLAQGENILRSTFLCIGGTALRSQVEVFAEIFLALNTRYPAEFVQWMKLLEIPNFPTAFVSAGEKEQFMRKVIKERVNKRLVQEHVRKFAAVCRNIVEYEGK